MHSVIYNPDNTLDQNEWSSRTCTKKFAWDTSKAPDTKEANDIPDADTNGCSVDATQPTWTPTVAAAFDDASKKWSMSWTRNIETEPKMDMSKKYLLASRIVYVKMDPTDYTDKSLWTVPQTITTPYVAMPTVKPVKKVEPAAVVAPVVAPVAAAKAKKRHTCGKDASNLAIGVSAAVVTAMLQLY